MKPVNQGTTAWRVIDFFNKAGAAAAPTALSYRVDCVTSGQAVRASTALAPAASVELMLTPDDTAIKDARNSQETKRVTVVAQYGSGADQLTGQFDFVVQQLPYLAAGTAP